MENSTERLEEKVKEISQTVEEEDKKRKVERQR